MFLCIGVTFKLQVKITWIDQALRFCERHLHYSKFIKKFSLISQLMKNLKDNQEHKS